jgi:hypothetical protein
MRPNLNELDQLPTNELEFLQEEVRLLLAKRKPIGKRYFLQFKYFYRIKPAETERQIIWARIGEEFHRSSAFQQFNDYPLLKTNEVKIHNIRFDVDEIGSVFAESEMGTYTVEFSTLLPPAPPMPLPVAIDLIRIKFSNGETRSIVNNMTVKIFDNTEFGVLLFEARNLKHRLMAKYSNFTTGSGQVEFEIVYEDGTTANRSGTLRFDTEPPFLAVIEYT